MNETEFRHFIKTYSGVPTRCFLVLGFTKRAMKKSELADWASADNEAVARFIRLALLDNYIIAIPDGPSNLYQLSTYAKQLPFMNQLPEADPLLPPADSIATASAAIALTPTTSIDAPSNDDIDCGETALLRFNRTAEKPQSDVVVDLKDSFKILKQQHQQQSDPTAEKPQSPLYDQFLKILTAGRVWSSIRASLARDLAAGRIVLSLSDVLGIVAWAFTDGTNIGAFVRHHIESGNLPEDKYRPPVADLARAIQWASASPYDRQELERSWYDAEHPVEQGADESLEAPVSQTELVQPSPDLTDSDRRTWQSALGELQLQLTKSTYDTWLRETLLLDVADHVFVIGVENAYTVDWLTNRLASTIRRTLTGIIGQPTDVRFVNIFVSTGEVSSPPES